jgi:N6-adenosine-specific RNA methylase IME4
MLPVERLAANGCALLLWCTGPHIAIGSHIEIIAAWGFKPKTIAFDWIKQNPSGNGLHTGMGYWTRSNAEHCALLRASRCACPQARRLAKRERARAYAKLYRAA